VGRVEVKGQGDELVSGAAGDWLTSWTISRVCVTCDLRPELGGGKSG